VLVVIGRNECRAEISFFLRDNLRIHYNFGWWVKNVIVFTQSYIKLYRKVRLRIIHQVIYMFCSNDRASLVSK